MKVILPFLFFLFGCSQIFSQKTFLVEKIGSTQHYSFIEGDYCKIRAVHPDTLLAGKLWFIGDSSIAIAAMRPYEVKLNNISMVYKQLRFPKKLGGLMVVGGLALFGIMTFNHLINNEQVFTNDMFILSGSMLAIGGISYALGEKRCRIGPRWKVKVLDVKLH